MSYSAAHDLKEQVRQATDIVDLVGSYLQLHRQGRLYVALCPWHDDSRPSLQVNPERQSWKCWPCDIGGDVFSFVMRRESVDFPEALRMLARRAGVELKGPAAPKTQPGSPNDKNTLYQAATWAEEQFHRCFLESREAASARDYVTQRGITEQSVARYRVGYAPNQWQWLLDRAKSRYSPAVLEAIGLVVTNENKRQYDRFRGRVIFPIRDPQRRVIAFGGRVLPEFTDERSAKYINSPETRLYSKSDQLYGLDVVRDQVVKQRHALIMEGYTDVVVTHQAGIDNVVAVCGTALGGGHLRLLKRYADRVTLVLDGDAAGQRRAAEVLELFVASPLELRIVTLPDGLDPCDFVPRRGADALQSLVDQAPDALDHHVQRVTQGIDLANDTHRAHQAIQRILGVISRAPRLRDDTTTELRLREQQTLGRLSRMFHVGEPMLRQQLSELRAKGPRQASVDRPEKSPTQSETLHSWEREMFTLLVQNPDAIAAVIENIAAEDLQTTPGRRLLEIHQQLEAEGQLADYQHLMDTIEDAALKNILVELADAAERMEADDAELQLRDLLARFAHRRARTERRQEMAKLQSGKLEEQEELALLNRLFDSKKHES